MGLTENDIATKALDICFDIHRQYGPGLFEKVFMKRFFVTNGIKRVYHFNVNMELL